MLYMDMLPLQMWEVKSKEDLPPYLLLYLLNLEVLQQVYTAFHHHPYPKKFLEENQLKVLADVTPEIPGVTPGVIRGVTPGMTPGVTMRTMADGVVGEDPGIAAAEVAVEVEKESSEFPYRPVNDWGCVGRGPFIHAHPLTHLYYVRKVVGTGF